jgi:four helix bundle protein
MDEKTQSPIFTKTSNFLLWLMQHTEKFPKSERFRLAKRIEDSSFEFYEDLIRAVKSSDKRRFLLAADLELDKVRLYIRLSHARRLTNHEQYLFAAESLTEIGKLLGGWLKTVPQIKGSNPKDFGNL